MKPPCPSVLMVWTVEMYIGCRYNLNWIAVYKTAAKWWKSGLHIMLNQKVAFQLKAIYFSINPSLTIDNHWKQLCNQAKRFIFERIFYLMKWEKTKSCAFQPITRVHIRFSIVPHFRFKVLTLSFNLVKGEPKNWNTSW